MPLGLATAMPYATRPLGGFNPSSLFAANEAGVWYDPSDLTLMFQDSAGATAAAVNSPVGLLLDKRLSLALGAEIVSVAADREFSSDTGYWTREAGVTIGSGVMTWTAAVSSSQMYNATALTAGKYYEITYTVTSISAGSVRFRAGAIYGTQQTAPGTYTERRVADGAVLGWQSIGASTTASIDNVTCKEVQGNHASQATTAAKPTLRLASGYYYLEFDGIDDWAGTTNDAITASNPVYAWAGLTLATTAVGAVACVGTTTTFHALFEGLSAGAYYVYSDGLNAIKNATVPSQTYTSKHVSSYQLVIGSTIGYRFNKAAITVTQTEAPAARTGTAGLRLGLRGDDIQPIAANIFQFIARGATTTAGDIVKGEDFCNTKIGAY